MLQTRYIIGFTGHRQDIDESRVRPALEQALTGMMRLAGSCESRAELYSSIAEGSDTLYVEIARQIGILPANLGC